MKPPQKLQELKRLWYQKLKKAGFRDIEPENRDTLRTWDSKYFREEYAPQAFFMKQRYYELAGQLLHTLEFKTAKDKRIWELHSQGLTNLEIARLTKVHNATVGKKVRYYASYIKS